MKKETPTVSGANSTRAYVLIDTEPGMTADVVRNLRQNGIRQADSINGPHDAIALIQGNSPSDVAVLILSKIRKMDGVKDVTVYLVTEQELADKNHGESDTND